MTKGFVFIQRPELSRDNPGYELPVRDMDVLLRIFDHDKNRIISETEWMQTMSGFAAHSHPGDLREQVVRAHGRPPVRRGRARYARQGQLRDAPKQKRRVGQASPYNCRRTAKMPESRRQRPRSLPAVDPKVPENRTSQFFTRLCAPGITITVSIRVYDNNNKLPSSEISLTISLLYGIL